MSITDLDLFWQEVLELTKKRLPPKQSRLWENTISAWLIPYQLDSLNNSITLAVMEKFQKNVILKNLRLTQTLQEAINEISNVNMSMIIIDMDEPAPEISNEQTSLPIDSPVIPTPIVETQPVITPVVDNDTEFYVPQYDDPVYIERKPMEEQATIAQTTTTKYESRKNIDLSKSNIKKDCRFDNYVVGSSNRYAFGAAQNVAEHPGENYNPLFLYGESGLGKTHLMHAIGNAILEKHPTLRVMCLPSETFMNMYVDMINRANKGKEFREIFSNIDVLLMDDIQFLQDKDKTKEEFFNRFNELLDNGKQIVLTSDKLPNDMKQFEDRIRTRFNASSIFTIDTPDLETRIGIVESKIEEIQRKVPDFHVDKDVINFVAMQFDDNVRDLLGAINLIINVASLDNITSINISFATDTLKNLINNKTVTMISEDSILEVIATYFNIKKSDLLGKRRQKSIAVPRHIAIYFCRTLLNLSYPQIGEVFNRDHTTALHAFEKIFKEKDVDNELKQTLEEIHKRLTEV